MRVPAAAGKRARLHRDRRRRRASVDNRFRASAGDAGLRPVSRVKSGTATASLSWPSDHRSIFSSFSSSPVRQGSTGFNRTESAQRASSSGGSGCRPAATTPRSRRSATGEPTAGACPGGRTRPDRWRPRGEAPCGRLGLAPQERVQFGAWTDRSNAPAAAAARARAVGDQGLQVCQAIQGGAIFRAIVI